MLRDLEYLVQLQAIDLKIHEQELAKEQLPEAVRELEQIVGTAGKAKETAINKTDETAKELKTLEEQILQAKEGLERSQTRLNSIKTNREYDAVHAEIETQKNIMHSSEGRIKKLADETEKVKTQVETAMQDFENVKNENDPKIAELRTTIASIDSVIAGIKKERDAIIPLINKSMLRTYELIRKRRKDYRVISHITSTRTCSVCYKVLEPQLMSEIKRRTKLIICQSCGSIFVWTEAATSPDAP
jgi:uncharacterized protein